MNTDFVLLISLYFLEEDNTLLKLVEFYLLKLEINCYLKVYSEVNYKSLLGNALFLD